MSVHSRASQGNTLDRHPANQQNMESKEESRSNTTNTSQWKREGEPAIHTAYAEEPGAQQRQSKQKLFKRPFRIRTVSGHKASRSQFSTNHKIQKERVIGRLGPGGPSTPRLEKGRVRNTRHMITGASLAAESGHFKIVPATCRTKHTQQAGRLLGGGTLWELSEIRCFPLDPKGVGEPQCLEVPLNPMDWLHRVQPLWPALRAPVLGASEWACLPGLGGPL